MALDPVSAALSIGSQIIERVWPDPAQQAAAKIELLKLQQSGELAIITAQTEINKVEAANPSLLVSGGRPFVIWVCGFALAYASIIEPIARFIATTFYGYTGAFPEIDTMITFQLLTCLLGLGGMRSFEKAKGVASR